MQYRPLGRTGLNVSAICLGTMTFGQQNSEAEGFEQMDHALEAGINFFDTAELYSIPPRPDTQGSTERVIGNWFKARGNREKVILATKVVGRTAMSWFRKDGSKAELSKAQIHEAVDGSLKRLQTDYIDLYQVHWPDRWVSQFGSNPTVFSYEKHDEHPIAETLDILDGLVKAGKVRHVGLSNESAWGAMSYLAASREKGLARPASIQNAYNLLNRTFEVNLAEVALREELSLLAYSPLGQGYLSGKYRHGALPAGSRKQLFDRLQRYETAGANDAIEAYQAIADDLGVSLAQLAVQFVTTRPFVTSNIIGATSMAQLKENIGSTQVAWSAETEARINAVHQLHCNPCP